MPVSIDSKRPPRFLSKEREKKDTLIKKSIFTIFWTFFLRFNLAIPESVRQTLFPVLPPPPTCPVCRHSFGRNVRSDDRVSLAEVSSFQDFLTDSESRPFSI